MTVFLLAAAVLTNSVFGLPEPLKDLTGVALLIWLAWVVWPSGLGGVTARSRLRVTVAAAATLGTAIATGLAQGPTQVLALGLFLAAIDWLGRRAGVVNRDLAPMQLTALLFAVFLLLDDYVGYVGYAMERVASATSAAASVLVPGDVSLGPGYLGLRVGVLLLIYLLCVAVLAEDRRVLTYAVAGAAGVIAACVAYGAIWSAISGTVVSRYWALLTPFGNAHDYRVLLFVLMLVPAVMFRLAVSLRAPVLRSDSRMLLVVTAAVALMLAVSLALSIDVRREAGPGTVILLDTGAMAQDLPDFDEFGLEKAGRFGLLPQYLDDLGYETRIVPTIGTSTLTDASTLVLINLPEKFDSQTKDAVWEFVAEGGTLLVFGDHTSRETIREPTNHLLDPVGIALNFDSAIPLRDGWREAYEIRPHPALRGIRSETIIIGVGASLEVSPPSRTVIIGRDGFSDPGNLDNATGGYLGDMAFSEGERVGDVPLAAGTGYGDGDVMVFGDTTLIQNPSIATGHEFVDSLFAWAVAADGGAAAAERATEGRAADSDYALIDMSHFAYGHLENGPESLAGLTVNLLRNGHPALVMREFSTRMVDIAGIVVVPAPMASLDDGEIRALGTFVENGGLLIVTAGMDTPQGSTGLLDYFGIGLRNVPLGSVDTRWEGHALHLHSAWPLAYGDPSGVQVLAEAWDYPVALYKAQGLGGVLAIGDSSFLLNKNLEDAWTYNEDNILFFRAVLGALGPGSDRDD